MLKKVGISISAYLSQAGDGLRDPKLIYGCRKRGIISENFPTLK